MAKTTSPLFWLAIVAVLFAFCGRTQELWKAMNIMRMIFRRDPMEARDAREQGRSSAPSLHDTSMVTEETPENSEATQRSLSSFAEIGNLDLLRSLAVAFVVVRHLLQTAGDPANALFFPQALGILGVLIFFVHTSLVLMMSMDRHGKAAQPPFAKGYLSFMVRRVFRIYPLSVLVVLIAFFILIPRGLVTIGFAPNADVLVPNLFLVQNLVGQPSIIGPLWSLPVEVQMYLFLPFLLLLVNKYGYKVFALWIWPASIVLALAHHKFRWIPEILAYLPCFLPGIVAFDFMRRRHPRVLPFWILPLAVLLMAVVYMAAVRRFGNQILFGYPVCLALGFLIGLVRDIPASMRGLHHSTKTIAKYSYGIYLFHDVWIAVLFEHSPWMPVYLRLPAMLLLTALSAVLGYHLIEAPCVSLGSRVAKQITAKTTT